MWLKSFERYFSVVNLPLSEDEHRQTTLRDYSEEVKIVSDVIFRVSQLCTLLLSEEQVSYSSFAKYIENSLRQDYFTDSYIRKLIRDQRPTRNMSLLMEALLDVRTLIHRIIASQQDFIFNFCKCWAELSIGKSEKAFILIFSLNESLKHFSIK